MSLNPAGEGRRGGARTRSAATGDLTGPARRRRRQLAQLVSFGLVGIAATVVNIAVYYAGVKGMGMGPNLSWAIGFLFALVVSFTMQRRWVFADSVSRSITGSGLRFFAVALCGFALNSLWVWLMVTFVRLPTWSPLPLVLFITPTLTYCFNRFWVFR